MKTAMQKLFDRLENRHVPIDTKSHLWQMLKENSLAYEKKELKDYMIGFYRWMLKHDTADYAEQYFHYSDEDMAEEYLKEVSPQDPAIEDIRRTENERVDREIREAEGRIEASMFNK